MNIGFNVGAEMLIRNHKKGVPMLTSELYHNFDAKQYVPLEGTKYKEGTTIFKIAPKAELLICSNCGSKNVNKRGGIERKIRTLPIGLRPVFFSIYVPRVLCLDCGVKRQINLKIADAKRSYTRALERLVLSLRNMMTLTDISKLLKISWDCVKEIIKRDLAKRFSKPKLRDIKYLAIDEISIAKGHKYLTVVMDLQAGNIVYVGQGKDAEALDPFWKRLRRSKAKIKAISTDLGAAYIKAVKKHYPNVKLITDHFHVVKLMNDMLSNLRRDLFNKAKTQHEKKVLKGVRWLLLKRAENLNPSNKEEQRLKAALNLNTPLFQGYYLKEYLRQIWKQKNKQDAAHVLQDWIDTSVSSGIRLLVKMGKTLAKHKNGILDWYDHPISSGPLEGLNNKIKTLKRIAYGFRDMAFFTLRILAIHEAKDAFTG